MTGDMLLPIKIQTVTFHGVRFENYIDQLSLLGIQTTINSRDDPSSA